ncbi:uncharacterized protein LOC111085821 [Limulus polyphemus]|uniref:Uncharacterized protein LOC111085821 n=1 Tax=Limulus polyphemus TaxID=6850 RepID=A0ABM1SE18_LIMPO|nr:uncharacterized protein LOC111085821 [Limulus polyphemus]
MRKNITRQWELLVVVVSMVLKMTLVFSVLQVRTPKCQLNMDSLLINCNKTTLDDIKLYFHELQVPANITEGPEGIVIEDSRIFYLPPIFSIFNSTLETLRVVHSQLEHVDPGTFLYLELRILDLSHNKLRSIPHSVTVLHSLQVLNLEHNNIMSMWTVYHRLTNLRELNLAYNQVKFIDSENESQLIATTTNSLQILNLRGNNLTTVPDQFLKGPLMKLKSLDLSENQLSIFTKVHFSLLPNLQTLDLHSNRLTRVHQFSFAVSLKQLDLTDNPLHCDCDVAWILEWLKTTNMTILLPKCFSPPHIKSQKLSEVQPDVICPSQFNHSTAESLNSVTDKLGQYEFLDLDSTASSISASWKVLLTDKTNHNWGLLYRKTQDNPYKMTLIPHQQSHYYIVKNHYSSGNRQQEIIYSDEIKNLSPETNYSICVGLMEEGQLLVEPKKCQRVQTKPLSLSTNEVTQYNNEDILATDQKLNNKEVLMTMDITPNTVTIRWEIVKFPASSQLLKHKASWGSSHERLQWMIRVRRFTTSNFTEMKISKPTFLNLTKLAYEYTVKDLQPSTGYEVCLIAMITDIRNKFDENYYINCREIETNEKKVFPMTEVAVATSVATCTTFVVIVIAFFCCPKSIFRCQSKTIQLLKRTKSEKTWEADTNKNKKASEGGCGEEPDKIRSTTIFPKERSEDTNEKEEHRSIVQLNNPDERETISRCDDVRPTLPTRYTNPRIGIREQCIPISSSIFRSSSYKAIPSGSLIPRLPPRGSQNYISLQHRNFNQGYFSTRNTSSRSLPYINPQEIEYIGGQKVQVFVRGTRTLPRNTQTQSKSQTIPFHPRFSLPNNFKSRERHLPQQSNHTDEDSSYDSDSQCDRSLVSVSTEKLWHRPPDSNNNPINSVSSRSSTIQCGRPSVAIAQIHSKPYYIEHV